MTDIAAAMGIASPAAAASHAGSAAISAKIFSSSFFAAAEGVPKMSSPAGCAFWVRMRWNSFSRKQAA